jgi:hypothetical protein
MVHFHPSALYFSNWSLQHDEINELVASETDAYAIADFINVSPDLLSVRLTAS